MKIAYITAGAAGMYCGSCMHDNTLVRALQGKGFETYLIPTYTPVRTDEVDVSMKRVFYSGINVFLQQKIPLFRYTPRWVDKLFERRALLNWVSKFSSSTNAQDLGALAVSTFEAEDGFQRKELLKLIEWLKDDLKPDLVQLTNSMFAGFAHLIKKELGCPVLCSLQGEDLFLEALVEPYKTRALELLHEKSKDIDGFVVNSRYYREFMSEYIGVSPERFHIVELGLNLNDFKNLEPKTPTDIFTVGFLARQAPEKGLHLAVEGFRAFLDDVGHESARLKVAGYISGNDKAYVADIHKQAKQWGIEDRIDFLGEIGREEKVDFMRSLDAFTVPAPYREPKGLYVLEALAAGVPVVQPRHGAFVEMVSNTEGGILVQPNSAEAVATGLRQIYDDREGARRMGEKGREVVFAEYSDDVMADKTISLYKSVVAQEMAAVS